MPTLNEVTGTGHEPIEIPSIPWLVRAIAPGLIRGGVYLLAGEPGIGKTTLAIQLLGDIARQGRKVLYLTTEQGLSDVKTAVRRIHGAPDGTLPEDILRGFFLDDTVDDLDSLPRFLARRVLTEGEEYHGVQTIVLDSVQGRGLSASATRKYRALYEFAENAKAQGLVTMFIGHVTKNGQIAGPKDLEHNVDCILYLRRAFRLRPFFVPKNRFGPALLDPLVLMMDDKGLVESPHAVARSSVVYGYAGIGDDLAEGQASVTLPRYGSRPELNAPFLPAKKVRQLVSVLSGIKDVDLTDLSYEINCYLPRSQRYREELDLPLALALLSSFLQKAIFKDTLFVGELDLTRRVRPPARAYLGNLANVVTGPHKSRVKRVFLSAECAEAFGSMRSGEHGPTVGEQLQIVGVETLEEILTDLWPELFKVM